MTLSFKKFFIPLIIGLSIAILSGPALTAADRDADYVANRSKLLSYMLRKKLTSLHFSHKEMDDRLSKNAFGLYVKQLDAQKRFLLASDIEQLQAYATRIDDEMISGQIRLPEIGAELLKKRTEQARELVRQILASDFDLTKEEAFETDPEKLDYCRTEGDLRERWEKILKYQILSRYMNMLEDKGLPVTRPDKSGTDDEGQGDADKSPAAIWQQAREKIQKSYDNFFSRMLEEDTQDHLDRYFDSIARAYDPHTDYLPPPQKEDFDIHMRGSLEGIGALLREEDGYIKVVRIIPGSAAFRQGQLQAEDIILEVGEGDSEPVDITDTRIRDAVALIRGKKGTEVRLYVKKPDGSRKTISIIRDVVQIEETFVKSIILKAGEQDQFYGYIKIPSFYTDFDNIKNGGTGRNVTEDVHRALLKLSKHKTDGLIIDLRDNGGGALEDAISVAGLFIKEGPIVQLKDSDGDIKILEDNDPRIDYQGPIVVLVSKFSASASEILAGALQDYKRAVIVGSEHTHGKGTVQTMVDLDYNLPFSNMNKYMPLGALKITTQKFYRVSGDSTQYRGVTPDIILPDRLEHLKTGEQYNEFSLPWDTVAPTSYQIWPGKGIDISQLREKSQERIAHNQAFADIMEMARKSEARSKLTLITLSFDAVKQQFEEDRLQKKKLSEAGVVSHGDVEDPEDDNKNMTADQQEKLWLKEIREDPYIKEAESILSDISDSEEKLSSL
jgi:carboxyl-terminal processing protease